MRMTGGILLMLCVLMVSADSHARKRRTIRSNAGRPLAPESVTAAAVDTFVLPDSSEVGLYGYDKPLRSRRETVFVANYSGHDITALSFTTQYIDSKGRQFHQEKRRVRADIPAGATRKIDYKSWDTQMSFYYIGSRPSRATGTPYRVRLSVDTIFVARDCTSGTPSPK